MKKKTNSSALVNEVNESNVLVEEVSSKKSKVQKPDVLEDSANKLEEEENERPKKRDVFSRVKSEIFGISEFDGNTDEIRDLAAKFASGEITFEEYNKALTNARKDTRESNTGKENLSFDDVCSRISSFENQDLVSDFYSFVSSDLLSLKSLLINNDKVIIYHASQSEDGEKFVSDKVTLKGAHKPYSDIIYKSFADITTSNILKAFASYSVYKNSIKRCKRQRKQETDKFLLLLNTAATLKVYYGYSVEELGNFFKDEMFEKICKELKKEKKG